MEQYTHIVLHTGEGNRCTSIAELEKIIEPMGVLIFCDQRIKQTTCPEVGMKDVYAREEEKLPPKNVLDRSIVVRLDEPCTEDKVDDLVISLLEVTDVRWLDKHNRKFATKHDEELLKVRRQSRITPRVIKSALVEEDRIILLISHYVTID